MRKAEMTNIDDSFFRRRLEQIDHRRVENGGKPPHIPPMDLAARLARLEEAISGLRHSQNLTIGATVGVGGIITAVIVALGVYSLQRVDSLNDRIATEANGIRTEIASSATNTRSELVALVTAISNTITAARQAPTPFAGSAPPPRR